MIDAVTVLDGMRPMGKGTKIVSFVVPQRDDLLEGEHIVLVPERELQTANLGIWCGMAAILWSLLAVPALLI